MKARHTYGPGEWGTLGNDWRRSLEADNKAPKTIDDGTVVLLVEHLDSERLAAVREAVEFCP